MTIKDLTVEEVAQEVGLAENTVRRLLRAGDMPGYKLGHKSWRVTRERLDAFKEAGGVRRPGRPWNEEGRTDDRA
ncbi:MAG: helix-turn-helix domain-containing protein [Capsulimonadaceae bacterium]|nr:helix-turn-helix domain-containing protein [Capsulimonadaceae bacterium]